MLRNFARNLALLCLCLFPSLDGSSPSKCPKSSLCRKEVEMEQVQEMKENLLKGLGMIEPPNLDPSKLPSAEMREYYRLLTASVHDSSTMKQWDLEQEESPEDRLTFFIPARQAARDEEMLVARFDLADDSTSEVVGADLSVYLRMPHGAEPGTVQIDVMERNLDGMLGDIVASVRVFISHSKRINVPIPADRIVGWSSNEPIDGLFVVANQHGRNIAVHPQQLANDFENMMIQLAVRKTDRRQRQRRQTYPTCTVDEPAAGCCLYDFPVNFTSIGWDWIITPLGVNAYYCHGDCEIISHHPNYDIGHSHIIHSMPNFVNNRKRCCHPTRYEPMWVVYINAQGMIVQSLVENMVATRCGCT